MILRIVKECITKLWSLNRYVLVPIFNYTKIILLNFCHNCVCYKNMVKYLKEKEVFININLGVEYTNNLEKWVI